MSLNIKELRLSRGLSQQKLSDETGIPKGRINGWEQQGTQPKKDDYDKLIRFFGVDDSNAIDRGPLEGEFETYTTKSGNEYHIVSDGNHRLSVKYVEQVAYAGYLAGWADPVYLDTLPSTIITVKKFHTGTYRVFEVSGDSMDYDGKRAIEPGDSVVAHKVDNDLWFRSKLHIHDWKEWVIVHDEGIIVKQITKHDVEAGVISCRSYNPDKNIYPDFDLSLDRVYELYNVVKIEKNR